MGDNNKKVIKFKIEFKKLYKFLSKSSTISWTIILANTSWYVYLMDKRGIIEYILNSLVKIGFNSMLTCFGVFAGQEFIPKNFRFVISLFFLITTFCHIK
jgi:hypothetical protein